MRISELLTPGGLRLGIEGRVMDSDVPERDGEPEREHDLD